jgi:hypothetical protein
LENAELRFYDNYDAFDNLVLRGGAVTMTTGTLVLNGDLTSLASASTASIGGLMLLNSDSTFTVADGPANHRPGDRRTHRQHRRPRLHEERSRHAAPVAARIIYTGATLINEGLGPRGHAIRHSARPTTARPSPPARSCSSRPRWTPCANR